MMINIYKEQSGIYWIFDTEDHPEDLGYLDEKDFVFNTKIAPGKENQATSLLANYDQYQVRDVGERYLNEYQLCQLVSGLTKLGN